MILMTIMMIELAAAMPAAGSRKTSAKTEHATRRFGLRALKHNDSNTNRHISNTSNNHNSNSNSNSNSSNDNSQ